MLLRFPGVVKKGKRENEMGGGIFSVPRENTALMTSRVPPG